MNNEKVINMSKNFLWSICIIAVLGILSSCKDDTKPVQTAPPPVNVAVFAVAMENASYYDEFPATVVALNQVDIRPQVNGYITGIFFSDGSHVRKGQKLYDIDKQQYMANYQQAQANLQVQESNLSKAQKDADRYHELEKHDAIAKQQVDYADAALESAKKQVDAAKANIEAVGTGLKYTTIEAPFEGTIGISQVKMGASVSAGQTLLNTVSTDDPMGVDFVLDQKYLPRFAVLQQKGTTSNDSTFRLELPGATEYASFGHIAFIDRAVDPQTGTIKARLVFNNKQNILRSGMTAGIRVLNNTGTEKMIIPQKAITEQMGEYFAYVVKTDSNVVHQKRISLGTRLGDKVVVNSGLNTGDLVVTDGVQKLREGAAVKIGPPPGGTAQAPTQSKQ
jgi:membrane fusion protein (multidrug efflux system)